MSRKPSMATQLAEAKREIKKWKAETNFWIEKNHEYRELMIKAQADNQESKDRFDELNLLFDHHFNEVLEDTLQRIGNNFNLAEEK